MRQPKRIPIVLQHLPMAQFIKETGVFENEDEVDALVIDFDVEQIRSFWESNPDFRLTQVLIQLGYLPNAPGFWFYTEEEEWLIDKGILESRDILFWGKNFDVDMNRLPETEWSLIKDMTTDHIEAILDGEFTKHPMYLAAFKDELEIRNPTKDEDVQDELSSCEVCGFESIDLTLAEDGRLLCNECQYDIELSV